MRPLILLLLTILWAKFKLLIIYFEELFNETLNGSLKAKGTSIIFKLFIN